MKYGKIVEGKFIDRPNRFIAHVEMQGRPETVHVKNTGRCRELLLPGAAVRLEVSDNPSRKTLYDLVRPEYTYGNSRIDFYMEKGERKYLLEVKGCTLEIDGIGYFPDAPTERGVKHLRELTQAVEAGYTCMVAFVIQMQGITEVRPYTAMQPEFGVAWQQAVDAGVQMLFLPCLVGRDSLQIVE